MVTCCSIRTCTIRGQTDVPDRQGSNSRMIFCQPVRGPDTPISKRRHPSNAPPTSPNAPPTPPNALKPDSHSGAPQTPYSPGHGNLISKVRKVGDLGGPGVTERHE